MKPCLIFDLDGTLVDSLRGIADTLNRTLAAHGLPGHADHRVRSFIGDGLRNLVLRSLPSAPETNLVESVLRLYRQDYELTWQCTCHPYPGIADMLADLERDGFPLAVLSNKVHSFTVDMVRGAFPDVRFQAIVGQRDGIPHKPDPDGALEISRQLSTPPEHCILVGDSTVDYLTARNAGMRAISVDWGYHDRSALEAAGSTVIVSNADELTRTLREQR